MNSAKQRSTFISYSRRDQEFALRLAKELKSAGYLVWLDQLDIPTGARWDEEVERALHESEIFLVILTRASTASENVKDEIGLALNLRKRILPILLEECAVPMRLSRIQYVDFTKTRFSEGAKKVERLLETLISDQLTPSVKSNPAPETPNTHEKATMPAVPHQNKPFQNKWMIGGAGIVALTVCLGILGVVFKSSSLFALSSTISSTPTTVPATPTLIPILFEETFDNNNADWLIDFGFNEFNDSGFRAYKHLENGKYYREMESNEDFEFSSSAYGSVPIPDLLEQNFCLIFDARIYDSPEDVALVINAREVGNFDKHYFISLPSNGSGRVVLESEVDRLIATIEKRINWIDEQTHTIKVSLQDDVLEVYELQPDILLVETSLAGNDYWSGAGSIRLGLQLFKANQKVTVEFDNIKVYKRCSSP